MSSSNLVSIVYSEETEYGKKESDLSAVTLYTARFTDEGLSGTPDTTESVELRTDRMSSGQVVTGLTVGGPVNFELSRDQFFDDWFRAGMMSAWVPKNEVSSDTTLTQDPADDQKATLTLVTPLTGVVVGDLLQIRPDGGTEDKYVVYVMSIDTPDTVFTVATERMITDLTNATMFVGVPAYAEIGTTQVSFHVGKAYEDVLVDQTTDERSQTYAGELVSGFAVNAAYGEIVTGSFTTSGNGYVQQAPSYKQEVITAGGTLTPAGTANPINSSIDVPLVVVDGEATNFCIENLNIEVDNGLDPQTCIGKIAPTGYALGTAAISITASIYLSDPSYAAFMPAKLSQVPISMTYVAENASGGYAFSMPAVQLSFPDPAAEGQNQQTTLDAEGTAKVGDNGESALRIYQLEA